MGVHFCTTKLIARLSILVLFQAVLWQPVSGRTFQQRFTFSRRAASFGVPAAPTTSAVAADTIEGSEIIVVLKPAKPAAHGLLPDKSSKEAVEDLKFAVANEAMRPIPLKNFLSKNGMNPKGRLPPMKVIKPEIAVEPMIPEPTGMVASKVVKEQAPAPPPVPTPDQFGPAGMQTTPPPGEETARARGDLRQMLTTEPPPQAVATAAAAGAEAEAAAAAVGAAPAAAGAVAPAPAPAPAGPPSTTPMMMLSPDAFAVRSARPKVTIVRSEDGHLMECANCRCQKHISGGLKEVEDPGCE